jgi:hypothetical protein
MRRGIVTLLLLAAPLPAMLAIASSGVAAQSDRRQTAPPVAQAAATLDRYCVTCHNERVKAGSFTIDSAALGSAGAHAEELEKVVRKLRTMAMPPPGSPRPDEATYRATAAAIEGALDREAATRPRLGRTPLAHRLSRTEYANAVRDLLAIEALPQELGIELLLPADNVSSGFDNIADLLFVSPSNMERYLDAARKISRLAIGDPTMPVMVNMHPLDSERPQDERVDDLPVGTRGGVAIRSQFPVDATYTLDIELAGAPREPHQLEITVDGARVRVESIGGGGRGAGGAGGGRGRGGGGRGGANGLEFPLELEAGTHLIGVAFVQRTEARDEATLRPRTRSRGTQPAIASVTIRGPHNVTGPGNSASRRRIFICRPQSAAQELPCARQILSALARRAYRRPVTDADIGDLMPFYSAGRADGSFDFGVQKAIERLLVSSQFLFRIERPPASAIDGLAYRVGDVDLASRLSFFLWSSIPDDELLDVAAAGRLKAPVVLDAQVRRMLADPRAEAMVTNFAAQWLYLRDITVKYPDEVLFQDFDETLREALRRETELFVGSVFRENRSVIDLISANYTFLNERLAKHYGIPDVRGSWFRRVELPAGSVRGGLLGHGSILTITSYATRTSPVLRGKWVLENLLSAPPPPPPPDVPSLSTEGTEPEKPLTMREAMIRHRANPACAGCHARMDPIGFAMEHFDAIGRWRETDNGAAIDATGVFPEGTKFTGIEGLKREILRQPDQFVGTMAERLLMYALGRNLQYYDQPSVRAILRESSRDRHTLTSLVLGVVKSRPFQMREGS